MKLIAQQWANQYVCYCGREDCILTIQTRDMRRRIIGGES